MAEIINNRRQHPVSAGRRNVAPSELGGELEHIRREAMQLDMEEEQKASGIAAPRFRATLCNLIMFVSHHGRSVAEPVIDDLINELCVSYPSRFFVIDYSCEGASVQCTCDGRISTSVSSRCVLANSGLHVCSEEIYIGVRPKSLQVVANLLLSLRVPDVSSVLLMLCDPARKRLHCWHDRAEERFVSLVRDIAGGCDLLVYDSALFDDFKESVAALLSADKPCLLARPNLVYRDLNWQRLCRWRDLIAEQFDSRRLAEAVHDIARIRFWQTGNPGEEQHPASASLLLAGWIISRLGWAPLAAVDTQLESGAGIICSAPGGSEPVVQFLAEAGAGSGSREMTRMEIALDTEEESVHILLQQTSGGDAVEVAVLLSTGDRFVRRAPLTGRKLEELVAADVQSYGKDDEHLQALAAAAKIAALL